MQVQIRTASEARPAMQMWEWFDLWQFHQVADQVIAEMAHLLPFDPELPSTLLDEGSRGERRMRRRGEAAARKAFKAAGGKKGAGDRHPASMKPDAQHHFYNAIFRELQHDHSRMTPEESKARIAHVDQWRKTHLGHSDQDIKDKPSLLKYGGHDMKTAAAAKLALDAVTRGTGEKARGKRHGLATRLDKESIPKLGKKERHTPEGQARKKAEMDAVFAKHAYTRPGEDVSSSTTEDEKKVHERLRKRAAHIEQRQKEAEEAAAKEHAKDLASGDQKKIARANKKIATAKRKAAELDINHKHNFARIAADTGVPEHEVRRMHGQTTGRRKGAHSMPIRELARVGRKLADKGEKLSHGRVGGILGSIMKNIHKTAGSDKTRMDFLRGAVARGGASGGDDEGGTTAMDTAEYSPSQTRAAERASVNQTSEKIHHPDSEAGKSSPSSASRSADHHHKLIDALNAAHANFQKKRGKDPAAGAMGKRSSVDVGDAIDKLYQHGGHSTEAIAKMLEIPASRVERHLDPKTGGGGEMGRAATSGKRAGAKARPDLTTVERGAHQREVKASNPSHAMLQDLHYLYPRRKGLSKEQDTALGRALLGGEMDRHKKEFADKIHDLYHGGKTSSGEVVQVPKPHQKSISGKEKKDLLPDWGKDKDKIFGSKEVRPGFQGGGRGLHQHPGPVPENATPAQRKKHQEKLDKFHDTLADRHEAVHKVMAPIIRNMTNPKHPLTQQWYDHHTRLHAAREAGDAKTAEHLGKKNIHGDLLRHHLNHAADDPRVQRALGIDPENKQARSHTANALTNIMRRVQTHGRNWMKAAQAHGLTGEKAKASRPKKGRQDKWRETPSVSEPQMVKVPQSKSGAGGVVGAETHKPEKFEPEKPGKGEERAQIAKELRTKEAAKVSRREDPVGAIDAKLAKLRAKKTNVKVPTAGQQPGVKEPVETPTRERVAPPAAPQRSKADEHGSAIARYHGAKRAYDSLRGRLNVSPQQRQAARQKLAASHQELKSRGLDPHNLPGARQASTSAPSQPDVRRLPPEEQARRATAARRTQRRLQRSQERQELKKQDISRTQARKREAQRQAAVPPRLRRARPRFGFGEDEDLLTRTKLVVTESVSFRKRLGL